MFRYCVFYSIISKVKKKKKYKGGLISLMDIEYLQITKEKINSLVFF